MKAHRVLLCVLVLGLSSGAQAQDASDEGARIHFQAATEYFQVADYEGALAEFTRAYQLSERPQLLYNLYLCQERLGHVAEAVAFLERYLREAPEVPERPTLEARLTNMRARLVTPDVTPDTTPDVTPDATPDATPDPHSGRRLAGYAVLGLSGVAVAGVLAFGLLASDEDDRLGNRCGTNCQPSDIETLKRYQNLADVSLAVGVVALGVGLGLVLSSRRGTTVDVGVSADGVMATARGRF